MRNIKNITQAIDTKLGSHTIKQALPIDGLEQISPVILLHHWSFEILPNDKTFALGVPPHPHRGFCPVTFLFDGAVTHRDSAGNTETIVGGEVQWINAGSGLLHAEKTSDDFLKQGGLYQGVQLWLNTKAKDKMKTPTYTPVKGDKVKVINKGNSVVRLISGELFGEFGEIKGDQTTAMITMGKDSSLEIALPKENNTIIYVLDGNVQINNDKIISRYSLVEFEKSDKLIKLNAENTTKILLVSGLPINEPFAHYGPFVMNTKEEIREAISDFESGKMGHLV